MIYIVHLNSVSNFLFVEFCATAEDINVLVIEYTTCSRVSGNIQVGNSTPSVVLDIILLAGSVETLGIVSADDENESTLRVESSEVRSLEEQRRFVLKLSPISSVFLEFHHPVAAHIVLMSSTDAEDSTLISNDCSAELWNTELITQSDLLRNLFLNIKEMD